MPEYAANDSERRYGVPRSMTILIQVSPGELIDKMTILEVKLDRMSDPAKLTNVRREHDMIRQTFRENVAETPALAKLIAELKAANLALWTIEDDIRDHERKGDFGDSVVALARSIYRINDERAAIKRRINVLLDSAIVEEKSYSNY
jgi:arginine deiminase